MSPRFAMLFPGGLLVVVALFWLMAWMLRPGDVVTVEREELPGVEIVRIEEETPEAADSASPESSPPPPPPAPPALARPDLPSFSIPVPDAPSVSEVAVPLSVSGGPSLSGSTFGGFGSGSGSGSGAGSGHGSGKGFRGRELVPLSTSRPMMPKWACEQKIHGWVEVIFTVMPNGRVRDVRIIDAEPRGVYEATAIQSVSKWIYSKSSSAREVKQKVKMDPADCAFDWR